MSNLLEDLKERLLQQYTDDNMNLVPLDNRCFVVTEAELKVASNWIGGSKVFGYNLVLSEEE